MFAASWSKAYHLWSLLMSNRTCCKSHACMGCQLDSLMSEVYCQDAHEQQNKSHGSLLSKSHALIMCPKQRSMIALLLVFEDAYMAFMSHSILPAQQASLQRIAENCKPIWSQKPWRSL